MLPGQTPKKPSSPSAVIPGAGKTTTTTTIIQVSNNTVTEPSGGDPMVIGTVIGVIAGIIILGLFGYLLWKKFSAPA